MLSIKEIPAQATPSNGFITKGKLTVVCGDDDQEFSSVRTNMAGVGIIDITPYTKDECTPTVTGDAQTRDVQTIITVGTDLKSSRKAILLAEKYNNIYPIKVTMSINKFHYSN